LNDLGLRSAILATAGLLVGEGGVVCARRWYCGQGVANKNSSAGGKLLHIACLLYMDSCCHVVLGYGSGLVIGLGPSRLGL